MQGKRLQKKKQPWYRPLQRAYRKVGTLNLILVVMFVFFLWFNWQMISLYRETNSIPETYAVAVIGATIGEAGICGWIRTRKMRTQERKWEKQDKKASKEPTDGAAG